MSKIASRRKHQRYGCLSPARLEFEDLVLEVTLMNFCHQGMLVNSSPEVIGSINQKIKNLEHPAARLVCHLSGATYELQVEIRRAYDTFFGVYVAEGLPPLLFENLGQTLPVNVSTQADKKDATAQSRQRLLAHDIVATCQNVLMPGVRRFYNQLPERLMNYAEKATQAHQVQKLFSLSSAIRQKTELPYDLQHLLRDKILEAITQKTIESTRSTSSLGELSLVETDEFDQWIAIKATAQRIENQVQDVLLPVIERLKTQYAKPEEMPMLPRGFAQLLQQQLIGQGFDQTSQRAALETFAAITGDTFKEFLEALNKVLEKHGYVPRAQQHSQTGQSSSSRSIRGPSTTRMSEEEMKKYASPQKVSSESEDDNQEPIPGLVPSSTAFDYQTGLASANESLHKVRALLKGLNKDTHTASNPVHQSVPRVGIDQLGAQLSQMTESLAQSFNVKQSWASESVIKTLYELFADTISSGNSDAIQSKATLNTTLLKYLQQVAQKLEVKLSPSDVNAIELVDTFFDDIQNNDFLIDDIKNIINQFRALVAADYLQRGRDFYTKSDLKNMVFQLQTIAYEPMVWVGRHKKNILMALDLVYQHKHETLLVIDGQESGLTTAVQQMNHTLNGIEKQITDIRLKNKKRLIDACMTRLHTQEKRNRVQRYLSTFLNPVKLIPRWLEQLMRMGWAEYLAFLSIRDDKSEEYTLATEKTRMLFDVVSLVTKSQTGLFDDLKNQMNAIMAFIQQGLTEVQTSSDSLEQWQELMTDIFNGHENKLLQLVPPSHWYTYQDDKKIAKDHYLLKKLEMVEAGQWLHCPHMERDKTYVQVAWISPDQSVFLLVNHSFVSIGEYTQQAMLDLLSIPTTRLINESLLPFMPKGIENQFYRIYDKIRNGLLRDQITGFLVPADLENQVNNLVSQHKPFSLFALHIKELAHIESIHGSEALNQCLAKIAHQLTEHQSEWLKNQSDFDLDFLARSQENHFYFVVLDLNHDDEQDIVMSTRLQKMIRPFITSLESALSSIKLGVNTVKLTPSFGYIDSTTSDMSSHYLIKAALQASQNQNPHFSVIDNVYMANPHDLEEEQKRQNMLSWINQVGIESLSERIQVQKNIIKSVEGQQEFLHLIPKGEDELINLIFQSGKGYLLDQWLIDQASELMIHTEVETVFVTLKSNIIEHNQFFEKLYSRMASLPRQKKLHFCFDNQHLPELESLADFCREGKSYGCEVSLFNWGMDARSFEILQYNFFSQLSIASAIITDDKPQMKALLHTLAELAHDMSIDLILSLPELTPSADVNKIINTIKPTYVEQII